ncbi:hypothetical protein DF047_33770 [Burkholderia cenocepacia]|jgi:hypothetical protein|uniref:hypothetical protein n=1 Tax=Burkholderia cenocepacia TaxID=95486 RepID=UPI000F5BEF67|nr:hypothetical protein [Burkholderia cenocepacia]RQU99893.1 hypothetical protein DF047_33770 [Burkholderia cenocepacia]
MLVIKLLVAAGAIAAIIFGIMKFNQHCLNKFGHAFFTKPAFYLTAVTLVLLVIGGYWRHSAELNHGDTLNGIVVMGLGVALAGWMVYVNIRRTDVVYGIGGSVAQLGLFSVLAWISLPLMALVLFAQFLLIAMAKPVYVVNR